MFAGIRPFTRAVCAALIIAACARPSAAPTAAAPANVPDALSGEGRRLRFEVVTVRDSAGRTTTLDPRILEAARARADSVNRLVRALLVTPSHLIARVGDTLAPFTSVRVTGLD